MDFSGFSSSEDEEELGQPVIPPVPPIPPTTPIPSSKRGVSGTTQARGGNRGGGRTPSSLPAGCTFVWTETGDARYTCSCQSVYTEKKSLLRHKETCNNNLDGSSYQASCKRRKLDVSDNSESNNNETTNDVQNDDEANKVSFNEDPEGQSLLHCKYIF